MSADAREIFSTGGRCLTMGEADGWPLTTVAESRGQLRQQARTASPEALQNTQLIHGCPDSPDERDARSVDVLPGSTPEGDRPHVAVSQRGVAIMDVSSDGVAHHLLCGPYSVGEGCTRGPSACRTEETELRSATKQQEGFLKMTRRVVSRVSGVPWLPGRGLETQVLRTTRLQSPISNCPDRATDGGSNEK
jgi:hypothetical protein